MMGPYYYYDSTYVEDVPAADYHIHDCMWSGECFTCQPALPVTLNAPPVTLTPTRVVGQLHDVSGDNDVSCDNDVSGDNDLSGDNDEEFKEDVKGKDKTSASQTSSRKRSNARRNAMRPSSKECSTQDNKKLRHREVEKNRHRQLQAMVKTLSEKIPGRLDKETQVQTMKRAARYCLFLREVKNLLSHGLPQPAILKDKLEKIYNRSCDNVELIITQSGASSR